MLLLLSKYSPSQIHRNFKQRHTVNSSKNLLIPVTPFFLVLLLKLMIGHGLVSKVCLTLVGFGQIKQACNVWFLYLRARPLVQLTINCGLTLTSMLQPISSLALTLHCAHGFLLERLNDVSDVWIWTHVKNFYEFLLKHQPCELMPVHLYAHLEVGNLQ